jgi:hypothetical protein
MMQQIKTFTTAVVSNSVLTAKKNTCLRHWYYLPSRSLVIDGAGKN